MTIDIELPQLAVIATNERATPSLVYRALLRSIRDGLMVPGAKLPNERDLAQQLNTSRTAVRSALAMMERQGLVLRRVGSGTYLTDDADLVFDRMDQTSIGSHEAVRRRGPPEPFDGLRGMIRRAIAEAQRLGFPRCKLIN